MKYYVNDSGDYLGGFDNNPPANSIEVDSAPDHAGQKWDGTKFLALVKPIQEQIDDLENSVTPRNYRDFVLGNQYSIDKINQVEADIAILRAKL